MLESCRIWLKQVEKVDFSKVESVIWQQQKLESLAYHIRVNRSVVELKCWQKIRRVVAIFKSTKNMIMLEH